jgi:hypothetical protein
LGDRNIEKNIGGMNVKSRLFFSMIVCCLIALGALAVYVEAAAKVVDFGLEIKMQDHTEYEMEYEIKNDKIEATYKVTGTPTKHGQDAQAMIEPFLQELNLTADANKEEVKKQILLILQLNPDDVKKFELEVTFNDGSKFKIER